MRFSVLFALFLFPMPLFAMYRGGGLPGWPDDNIGIPPHARMQDAQARMQNARAMMQDAQARMQEAWTRPGNLVQPPNGVSAAMKFL